MVVAPVSSTMEVNCAGCAGCCLDWRPLVDGPDGTGSLEGSDHERRGPHVPLDDTYNLVALSRDEVRAFLEAGLGDALTVRLWDAGAEGDAGDTENTEDADETAPTENAEDTYTDELEIDGHRLASIAGRPAFFVGLRKPPKPVAPFDREEHAWLPTCVFLDPATLQCRIHDDDLYPSECAEYPAHNLALERETECERVETAFGGERLLDDDPGETEGLLLGPQAIGQKVFTYPRPEALTGVVDRVARGELTREDSAEFVAIAAASSPGTLATSESHYEEAKTQALEADSWIGRSIRAWEQLAERDESPDEAVSTDFEEAHGAPETPGWDALE